MQRNFILYVEENKKISLILVRYEGREYEKGKKREDSFSSNTEDRSRCKVNKVSNLIVPLSYIS